MNIIFAGTPEFAVAPLKALAQQHLIAAVFTQPDRKAGRGKKLTPPPVKEYAQTINVPVFQPSSLRDQADLIQSFAPDLMVVVAYGMLLPQEILDIPRLGCLNIHASILPRWRGAAPIQRAIEAGDTQTGVSIMRMESGLDTGPVFKVLTTDIKDNDTSTSLHDTLAELGSQGICEVVAQLQSNPNLQPTPQDHANSNYAKKISKREAEIDWHKSATELHQQLRAFIPWPISQTQHAGMRIRVWQASVIEQQHAVEPGTIMQINESGVAVACGQNLLQLEKLQRDGSKPLPFHEFKNGYQFELGDKLGTLNG